MTASKIGMFAATFVAAQILFSNQSNHAQQDAGPPPSPLTCVRLEGSARYEGKIEKLGPKKNGIQFVLPGNPYGPIIQLRQSCIAMALFALAVEGHATAAVR